MPIKPAPSVRDALKDDGDKPSRPAARTARAPRTTKAPTSDTATKAAPKARAANEKANRPDSALSAEQLLISSVLNHGEMHLAVQGGVTTSMFVGYTDEWSWIQRYYTRHKKTPTIITFRQKYPDFRIVQTANDTEYLADEMRRIDTQTVLVQVMRDSMENLRSGNLDEAVTKIAGALRTAQSTVTVAERDADLLGEYDGLLAEVREIRERADKYGNAGVPWGFSPYDARTGGAKPGELIIVGARLGEGKTLLMTKWATEALLTGRRIQYNALEMSKNQMALRLHSMISAQIGAEQFNSEDLTLGKSNVDLDAYEAYLQQVKDTVHGKLFISDASRGRVTVRSIERQIERNHPDIVFVDYLTLLGKNGSDWQAVAELSGELKVLATEAGIPIVAGSQLNRSAGIGKDNAGADALSQADAIGQDADTIITLKLRSPHAMSMKCVKNRHGRSGFTWHVEFDPGHGKIEHCTYEKLQELMEKDRDDADSEQDSDR